MFWCSLVGQERTARLNKQCRLPGMEIRFVCPLVALSVATVRSTLQKSCMFRSGRVDVLVFFGRTGADRPPKQAMQVAIAYLEQEVLGFGVLCWERKVIRAEKTADGRVPLPARSGYISEIGVQLWRKVDVAGYTRHFSDTAE